MNKLQALTGSAVIALLVAVMAIGGPGAYAAHVPTVGLGTAGSFAVLAGSGISNTGPTVVNGDIGSFPTTTISGFPPGIVNGTDHGGDAVTQGAKTDLVTAYDDAAGRTPVTAIPTELGGSTLRHGVYAAASGTFGLTGALTLDAQGDPNAVFIFKTASTLTTGTGSSVVLIGGAQACNVFWQVGSSATLGGSTSFKGNILALTSITLVTNTSVEGRLLARDGAVTLDTNTITRPACALATATPTAAPAATATVVPVGTATSVPTAAATPGAPGGTATSVPTAMATVAPFAPAPTSAVAPGATAAPASPVTPGPGALPAPLVAPLTTATPVAASVGTIGSAITRLPSSSTSDLPVALAFGIVLTIGGLLLLRRSLRPAPACR